MQRNLKPLFSFLKPQHQQWRAITRPRLKWRKNHFLDPVVIRDNNVKAAILLKDAIKRSPTSFISSQTFQHWQIPLNTTIPVLSFLRNHPALFLEFPHPRYPSLPCFRLNDTALLLDNQEQSIYDDSEYQFACVETLCRVLMMLKSEKVFLHDLYWLRFDLGLPDRFETRIVENYPGYFRLEKDYNGLCCVSLVEWRDEFAVPALKTPGIIPMSIPPRYRDRGYVKGWVSSFQDIPYISPYEDFTYIDPTSDIMEKRVVGVLHELLSRTVHKKTLRDCLRNLKEELGLPNRFTKLFTRYPWVFYQSLKCNTTTVVLKEGYRYENLISQHPLVRVREKVYDVMKKPEEEDGLPDDSEEDEEDEKGDYWDGCDTDMSDDLAEAEDVYGLAERYSIQSDKKVGVCSVHPTEHATLQCLGCVKAKLPDTKSYHCSPKCFSDAWQRHRALHDRAASAVNEDGAEEELFGQLNSSGSGGLNIGLSSSASTCQMAVGHPMTLTTSRVIPAPTPTPRRMISVSGEDVMGHLDSDGRSASVENFTVLSYNILAEAYATSDAYSYCPSRALSCPYRRHNLLVAFRSNPSYLGHGT